MLVMQAIQDQRVTVCCILFTLVPQTGQVSGPAEPVRNAVCVLYIALHSISIGKLILYVKTQKN